MCLSHFLVLFYLRPFPDSRKMRDFMALSPCVSTKATQLLVWWSMVHQFFRFFWLHFQGGVIVLVNVVDRIRLTTFTVYNIKWHIAETFKKNLNRIRSTRLSFDTSSRHLWPFFRHCDWAISRNESSTSN